MSENELTVQDGMVVGLHYTLRLDDGEVVDTSAGRSPLEFLQGEGQIIPGLEQELYGMSIGEEKQVTVAPADAYGLRDPNALELVPFDVFPPDLELSEGMRLHMRNQAGQVFTVSVAELQEEGALIDFNHPLAGETLYFDVKIATLRAATPEELAHGHSH